MQKVAILLTVHNRIECTLACLDSLRLSTFDEYSFDIYLVNDGSTDSTEEVLLKMQIGHVLQGDGSLYWARGMNYAWKTAAIKNYYDYYLWLNNDVILNQGWFNDLIAVHNIDFKSRVLTVGLLTDFENSCITYGCRDSQMRWIDRMDDTKYINGNVVLVPSRAIIDIGFLDDFYLHGYADFDYGIQALKSGYSLRQTQKVIGVCDVNKEFNWSLATFSERWNYIKSPTGISLTHYLYFKLKNAGLIAMLVAIIKLTFKLFVPTIYEKIVE